MGFSHEQAVKDIIWAGNCLNSLHLAPATAGNYSVRLNDREMAITVSGVHKGRLQSSDIMRTDLQGKPLENKKSSAETLLHSGLYGILGDVHAILHTHSVPCTVLTRILKDQDYIDLEGYELLKIFPHVNTHDTKIRIPIFENSQDMIELQDRVSAEFKKVPETKAYLLRGHGLYAWGADMNQALHVVEAIEFLLSCELETRKLAKG